MDNVPPKSGITPLIITTGKHSSRGKVRERNEDSSVCISDLQLFIVSDGMGGQLSGNIASNLIIKYLPVLIRNWYTQNPTLSESDFDQGIKDVVVSMSQLVHNKTMGKLERKGMGATLAMLWIIKSEAFVVNMGDSRIYVLRAGKLVQLSEDHTITAILLKNGDISREDALKHPSRGKLSRFVGMEGIVYPDVKRLKVKNNDRFLLCSDGLTEMLSDKTILEIMQMNNSANAVCRSLVGMANNAGGKDNVTALVVDVQKI